MTAAQQQFDAAPQCPKCGADMWDNREDNALKRDGRRRPDFRCKDDREHVIWPPQERKGGKGAAKPSQEKGSYSIGRLPGVDDDGAPGAAAPRPSPLSPEAIKEAEKSRRDRICVNMKTAINYFGDKEKGMLKQMDELDIGYTPETTQALITTLFIALNDSRIR